MQHFRRLIAIIGKCFLLFMICIIIVQIIFRYIIGSSIPWTEEVARLCFIWITFIGAGLVSLSNEHIKLDLISWENNIFINRIRLVLINTIMIIILVILFYYGIKLMLLTKSNPMPASQLPTGYFLYASITIGSLIMIIGWISDKAKHFIKT